MSDMKSDVETVSLIGPEDLELTRADVRFLTRLVLGGKPLPYAEKQEANIEDLVHAGVIRDLGDATFEIAPYAREDVEELVGNAARS